MDKEEVAALDYTLPPGLTPTPSSKWLGHGPHSLYSDLLSSVLCSENVFISSVLSVEGDALQDDLLLPSLVAYTVSTSCCRQMLDGAYLDETSERPGRPLEGVINPPESQELFLDDICLRSIS